MSITNLRGTMNVTDGFTVNGTPVNPGGAVITQQTTQADSTATDVAGVKADLNALLGKLRASGVLAAS